MTLAEKHEKIQDYCDLQNELHGDESCEYCVVSDECDACGGAFGEVPELVDEAFDKLNDGEKVNHPNHYNSGMECIDEMLMIFGEEAVAHFCLCNAWKYRYRAVAKGGQEDIDKSHWYIAKYKELTEWKRTKDLMSTLP